MTVQNDFAVENRIYRPEVKALSSQLIGPSLMNMFGRSLKLLCYGTGVREALNQHLTQ